MAATRFVSPITNEEKSMRKLLAAMIAALFAATTFCAIAADEAKPADPTAKPAKEKKHKKEEHKKSEAPAPTKQ